MDPVFLFIDTFEKPKALPAYPENCVTYTKKDTETLCLLYINMFLLHNLDELSIDKNIHKLEHSPTTKIYKMYEE